MHEHNSDKLLKLNLAVSIDIRNGNHLFNLLAGEFTLKSLTNFLQFTLSKALLVFYIEHFKRLQ